jgi:hypothetical protein
MTAILNVYLVVEHQIVVAIIAGCLAIIFGSFNIKDFFLFKQGPSLSIPDEKKSKIYKQIRNVSKMPYISGLIFYTIILAISVNTVELLCSLGLPLIYTEILTSYNLTNMQYYMYIIMYNIVYVLPLIFIVLIFVIILKKWKLTEWQGRVLKLYSGILMFSLGLILIINRNILHHILSAVGLIVVSMIMAFVISLFYKKKLEKTIK